MRLDPSLSLERALQTAEPGWQRLFARPAGQQDPKGSPALLLVSSSALRAAHLLQQLPTLRKVRSQSRRFAVAGADA